MYDAEMRVILSADGSLNIGFSNKQTVPCTTQNLMSFLNDPFQFLAFIVPSLKHNSRYVNPRNLPLAEIPGLTLAYVTKSNDIVSVFPEIYHKLFTSVQQRGYDANISFEDLLNRNEFTDQKLLMLRIYLEMTKNLLPKVKLNRSLKIASDTQANILGEIVNTLCHDLPLKIAPIEGARDDLSIPFPSEMDLVPSGDDSIEDVVPAEEKGPARGDVPAGYVSVNKYAEIVGKTNSAVRSWLHSHKLHNVYKDSTSHVWLDPTEIPGDLRAGRRAKPKENGKKYVRLQSSSFEDVQKYIKGRAIVTEKIRPFIRTGEEARYYYNNNYHEVHWTSRNALIIDVNLDYRVESKNMTNRELILSGSSPVVPGRPNVEFQLHHIGQRNDSPFAIIPGDVHNSKEMSSFFHSLPSKENPVNRDSCEREKLAFWREYVERLDSCGGYKKVPYENSRDKRRR